MTSPHPQLLLRARLLALSVACLTTGCVHATASNASCPQIPSSFATLRGQYVVMTGPKDYGFNIAPLLRIADAAISRYAALFDLPLPRSPLPVTLCAIENAPDVQGLQWFAEHLPLDQPGRSDPRSGAMIRYIPSFPRAFPGMPGVLEDILLIELARLFQQRFVPNFSEQPPWFRIGISEFLAFLVLSEEEHQPLERLQPCSNVLREVLLAASKGEVISLERLFSEPLRERTSLRQSEAFSLLLYLDRVIGREPLTRLLRDLAKAKSRRAALGIGARIRAMLPGGDKAQAPWMAWLRQQKLSRWAELGLDVRQRGDDLFLETARGGFGVVTDPDSALEAGATLEARVHWVAGGASAFDVLFGSSKALMGVDFDRSGATSLWALHGEVKQTLRLSPINSSITDPRVDHRITIHIDASNQLIATVDDTVALEAELSSAITGSPWGFGVTDGAIIIKAPRVRTAP